MNIKGLFHAFRLKPTPTVKINFADDNQDFKYQLSREDIQKAIKYSNPTYQAIFIVQAQTGLAISDTLQLNVKDFIDAVTKEYESLTVNEAIHRVQTDKTIIDYFDMRRKKTSNDFYTFIGHEALLSIALLLESRDEDDLTPDSPIFMKDLSRVRFLNDKYIGNLKIKEKKKLFTQDELRLNVSAVEAYTSRMHLERNVFKTITANGKRKSYFKTHKLRKWYSNQLRFKASFNMQDTKYLMGQTTGDVFERYADPNNYNFLKKKYTEALPYLSINDEIVIEENKEAIDSLTMELQEERGKREAMEKMIQDMDLKNRKIDARLDEILTNRTVLDELRKKIVFIINLFFL